MGISLQQIIRKNRKTVTFSLCILFLILFFRYEVVGADTPGIDDDTVISVGQAGSVAPSAGYYGWDSRGAIFDYSAQNVKMEGSLGQIMFFDRSGKRRAFLWDEWGGQFPEWWGRMLAERIRNASSDDMIPIIRSAFADYVTFNCRWIIAIGTKNSNTNSLYKTLRTDGTLRTFNRMDLDGDAPSERLFTGSFMDGSLGAILPGETWGSGTLETFRERDPYRYDVRIRSFDVKVRATNCIECAKKKLPTGSNECTHVSRGSFFNIEVPIIYDGKSYSGVKSFVWEGQTVSFAEPQYEGHVRKREGDDLSGFHGTVNGNSITPVESSEIYLYYEEVKKEDIRMDLTIKYVVLKASGTSVSSTVKTVEESGRISEGELFSVSLEDRIVSDGEEYMLVEGAQTALSYASSHKFANAVKGINAYKITASSSANGRITYATGEPYDKKMSALLYVPVIKGSGPASPGTSPVIPGGGGEEQGGGEDIGGTLPSAPTSTDIAASMTDPNAILGIRSDIFDVSRAVPSAENVYITASFKNYLYSLDAVTVSGKYPIRVTVNFPYTRTWTGEGGEKKNDSGVRSTTVTVYRDYQYNHLNSFVYYTFDSLTVGNPAMEPGMVSVSSDQAGIVRKNCSAPVVYGGGFASIGANIDLPLNCPSSLTAAMVSLSGDHSPPAIPAINSEIAKSMAEAAVGQMRCRNDLLIFDGVNILGSSGWHTYSGPAVTNTAILAPQQVNVDSRTVYGEKSIVIPASVRNALYPSNIGVVRYRREVAYGDDIFYDPVVSVNSVNVFTPVICSLAAEECDPLIPNISYTQDCKPVNEDRLHAVVGAPLSYGLEGHENDTCDFYLSIDNSGYHPVYSGNLGNIYDYSVNRSGLEGGSYVGVNEVYFPFDVYEDINDDRDTSNDILLTGKNWYPIGRGRHRFYVPDTVPSGDYCIEARSRAVNAVSRNDLISSATKNGARFLLANEEQGDHVTADSIMIHVTGKMYGLRLTDVASDAEWASVFAGSKKNTAFPNSGVLDGTLRSVLPGGTVVSARLNAYSFYYTVGVYNELGLVTGRNSKFTLPTVSGASPDSSRLNSGMLKAGYVWEFELITSSDRMREEGSYIVIEPRFEWISSDTAGNSIRKPVEVFYSETVLGKQMRNVLIGNTDDRINTRSIPGINGRAKEEYSYGIIKILSHQKADEADEMLQKWTFEYSLPAKLTLRADGKICREGYLVISFLITAYDSRGEAVMSYSPTGGYCNMWALEGQARNKTDYYGKEFDIRFGDVAIIDIEKTKADDYMLDHRY